MPALVVRDLPVEAEWIAYAFSPATFTIDNDESMTDWGTCTAAVYSYSDRTNRTAIAEVPITVTTITAYQKVLSITAADMTELLGSNPTSASYWFEFAKADGEVVIAGKLVSTVKASC